MKNLYTHMLTLPMRHTRLLVLFLLIAFAKALNRSKSLFSFFREQVIFV